MRQSDEQTQAATLQAGLRTLHEAGPELKRAISGALDEITAEVDVPMHRVSVVDQQYYNYSRTLAVSLSAINRSDLRSSIIGV